MTQAVINIRRNPKLYIKPRKMQYTRVNCRESCRINDLFQQQDVFHRNGSLSGWHDISLLKDMSKVTLFDNDK